MQPPTHEDEQQPRRRWRAVGTTIVDLMAAAGASMCGYPMALPGDATRTSTNTASDDGMGQDDGHSGPSWR